MSYSCCCLPNGTPQHLQQGILQQRKTKIHFLFKNNNLVLKQGSSVEIFPVARNATSFTIFWQDLILEVQVWEGTIGLSSPTRRPKSFHFHSTLQWYSTKICALIISSRDSTHSWVMNKLCLKSWASNLKHTKNILYICWWTAHAASFWTFRRSLNTNPPQ
jgi:hypothetical protein